jgi:dipeptidase E
VEATDALLFWGGDPVYLAAWLRRSGLAALLPSLRAVYVGTSAGSIAAAGTFVETFHEPLTHDGEILATEEVRLGEHVRTLVTAHGAGLVDFTVIPHFDDPDFPDALPNSARTWAARMPGPTYALDDQSAVAVVDGVAEVVSEGRWELFT